MEATHPRIKPAFQRGPLLSLGEDENPESQCAENDVIDSNFSLLCAEPVNDSWIGRWFGRFAKNVGVDQLLHRVFFDSKSMGTKESVCGQANSQSMAPPLFGGARRTRRCSPGSRRMTSKICPGSTRSNTR